MSATILAAVDLHNEETCAKVADAAASMAAAQKAALHYISVIPDERSPYIGPYVPKDMKAKVAAEAEAGLAALARSKAAAGLTVETHVAHGTIYVEILELAARIGADTIVIGAHRPELMDFLLGPNAARVARHAGCSVLVVR